MEVDFNMSCSPCLAIFKEMNFLEALLERSNSYYYINCALLDYILIYTYYYSFRETAFTDPMRFG